MHAPEALEDYLRCYRNPETIHAACEDYRAGATYDFALDEADRGQEEDRRADARALGRSAARSANGTTCSACGATGPTTCAAAAIDSGHFMAEEAPLETYAALREFFSAP